MLLIWSRSITPYEDKIREAAIALSEVNKKRSKDLSRISDLHASNGQLEMKVAKLNSKKAELEKMVQEVFKMEEQIAELNKKASGLEEELTKLRKAKGAKVETTQDEAVVAYKDSRSFPTPLLLFWVLQRILAFTKHWSW